MPLITPLEGIARMIIVEKISEIASLLLRAAKEENVATMWEFHNLFEDNIPMNDKYDTLEAASRALEYPKIAIYSAVLAKKDTGLPGGGFFDVFLNSKREKAIELIGEKSLHQLTLEDKKLITEYERKVVYKNAQKRF